MRTSGLTWRRVLVAGAVSAMAASLTACGSSGNGSADKADAEGSGKPEVTKLSIGVTPVGDFAPVYYAQSKGIFAKHGLEVKIDPKGASEVPPLVSNSYQMVTMSWTTYIQAVAQGVDLEAVYPGISGAADSQTGIYVMPSSGITDAQQLVGKSVGINQPKASLELNSRVALRDLGVDDAKVNFTVIPMSTLGDALIEGKLDAAYLVPPFSAIAASKGAKLLVNAYSDAKLDGLPVAGYVMTKKFIDANPETAKAFTEAMSEAAAELNKPGAYQAFIPSYTTLTPELAKTLPVYSFATSIDAAKLQAEADLMAEEGFATRKITVADHLYAPAK